jgi:hypothetical protein
MVFMNVVIKTKRILLFSLFFISAGFFSCSKAEPIIHYGFMELVYYPGISKSNERYSFFILPEDDDGIDNLSELYLYHDREGLRWLITSNDWIVLEEDGKTWIGSRNIAMYDDGPLPRGQYRAVLYNKGGESTERRFTYDGPETPPYPSPELSIEAGMYNIDSRYPVNRLICYDQQGKTVQTLIVRELKGSIRDLRLTNTVRTVALWAEEPLYRISVLTEAVLVR